MSNNEVGAVELVKLVSGDGYEFVLDKKVALGSKLIKKMLEGEEVFFESDSNVIVLDEIYGVLLEKIVDYLHYRSRVNAFSTSEPKEPRVEKNLSLDLLLASDYLGV